MPVPPVQTHERYERVFAEVEAPFAFVDLEAMWANAEEMLGRAGEKPIRVASKSIRCRALLEAILARDPRFRGLMTYTLPETLWLAEQGFENLLLAYPTADVGGLEELALRSAANSGGAPIVMVDCVEHLEMIESVLGKGAPPLRVCVDVDASWWWLGGRVKVGPKRSPIHTVEQAMALAREIEQRPQIELDALMAYEGQIAGVGDRPPGQWRRGAVIRFMQKRSVTELAERRAAIVAALSEFVELEIVNGGGTGSLELTAAEEAVTEVTAGSGFYAPALFDHYSRFSLTPAAGFALPIVRKPATASRPRSAAATSPPARGDEARLPVPWLPEGLELDSDEGAGEVQTPLLGPAAAALEVGDRAYLRHAKAGELCERFDTLYLVEGERDRRRGPHLSRRGKKRSSSRYAAEDPVGVLVGEGAAGVQGIAGVLELVPGRVARRQGGGGLEVALAPVGPAAVGIHDRLHRLEVGAPLHPPVLVHGDVSGVAFVRGAEEGVVPRGDPHLDREEDRVLVAPHPLDHPPRRLGAVLARHPVLHLGEADAALVDEDPVAAVDGAAARGEPPGQPGAATGSSAASPSRSPPATQAPSSPARRH